MSAPPDARASTEELVAAARAGVDGSFSELVRRYQAPLYRFLLVRCRDPAEAEELCQQSFVRCWRKLHTFRAGAEFAPWLFGLSRRVTATHLRRRRSEAPLDAADDPPSGERGPGERSSDREEAEALWDLAARVLDRAQRSALWLRYAEDMSAREIGAVLGKREDHVRVLLHRARRRLAEHLPEPAEGAAAGARPAPRALRRAPARHPELLP